jgi:hypothetical protein
MTDLPPAPIFPAPPTLEGQLPDPPVWHVNPHNGCPKDYYRYGVETRAYVRAWIDHALSPENRTYRLEKLSAAIGLPPSHVMSFVEGRASFGDGIMEIVNAWAADHAEISLNAPTDDTTFLAHLGDLG